MHIDPLDVQQWAADLKLYQSQRKQDFRFDKDTVPKIITQKEEKARQIEFHPVLQTFVNQQKEQNAIDKFDLKVKQEGEKKFNKTKAYMHEYDLVNLKPIPGISRPDEQEKLKQNILPPNFNDYNIITNNKLEDAYYKNMRVVISKKIKEKPVINRNKRDYNILSNKFFYDNDTKHDREVETNNKQLEELYARTHNVNYVTGQYYDNQREQEFQEYTINIQTQNSTRRIEQSNHGKDFSKRLPPSWKFRESVYLDQTKEVPEEIIMIDQINHNKKKRYELRNVIEQEYRERDIDQQERTKERKQNYVKYDDVIKKYDKGEFDIITIQKPQIDHIIKQMPTKPPQNSWDKVQMTKSVNNNQSSQGDVKFVNEGMTENVPAQSIAASAQEYRGRLVMKEHVNHEVDLVAATPTELRGAPYKTGVSVRFQDQQSNKPPTGMMSSSNQKQIEPRLPRIDPKERRESQERRSGGGSQNGSQKDVESRVGSHDSQQKGIIGGGFFHQTVY